MYEPSEADKKKLENNFVYHAPLPGQAPRYELVREMAKAVARTWILFVDGFELAVIRGRETGDRGRKVGDGGRKVGDGGQDG